MLWNSQSNRDIASGEKHLQYCKFSICFIRLDAVYSKQKMRGVRDGMKCKKGRWSDLNNGCWSNMVPGCSHPAVLPSPKRLFFWCCCRTDYRKTTWTIYMKHCGRVQHGPRKNFWSRAESDSSNNVNQIAIADLHIIEEWTVVIGGVLQVPF